jgi:hypothetical protein
VLKRVVGLCPSVSRERNKLSFASLYTEEGGERERRSEVGVGGACTMELELELEEEKELDMEMEMRVLVVDDSPIDRKIVEGLLKRNGNGFIKGQFCALLLPLAKF